MKFIVFLNDECKITADDIVDLDNCVKQFDFVKSLYIECEYDDYLKILDMEVPIYDS